MDAAIILLVKFLGTAALAIVLVSIIVNVGGRLVGVLRGYSKLGDLLRVTDLLLAEVAELAKAEAALEAADVKEVSLLMKERDHHRVEVQRLADGIKQLRTKKR